ncbi:MAG TPA: hypothetical protein VFR15_06510 [Chloroflexia bacterium]|nr:hypothetical protein [Chloroflexia bacterium]
MKRLLSVAAALVLVATGYMMGSADVLRGVAGPLAQGNCQTFPETRQAVCGRFLQYWQQNGGLAQQGFPISAEFQEKSDLDGKTYTVQYFERAVFEHHPENQPPYDVLLSQLGLFRWRDKYGGQQPPGPGQPPPAPPTATSEPLTPIFAEIGDRVRRNGVVFAVIRLDQQPRRLDVIWTVKNETGGPITFVLRNSDQRLLNDADQPFSLIDPEGVKTLQLANGQEATVGTSWSGRIAADASHVTYVADNMSYIGGVRIRIPAPPPLEP